MKTLSMSVSTMLVALAIQGCTVSISSTEPAVTHSHDASEPAAHTHPLEKVAGQQRSRDGVKTNTSDVSGTLALAAANTNTMQRRGGHPTTATTNSIPASVSVEIAPKKDSGLNAKTLLDAATAIVLGCIQHRC